MQKKLLTKKIETTFIFGDGFSNWKKATGKEGRIPKHENSECHRESMIKFCENGLENDIGAKLSNEYQRAEEQNRQCLLQVIDVIKYLTRQGIPLRGRDDLNSNFNQLMLVQAKRDPNLKEWLKKKTNKYTSHESQTEIIKIIYEKMTNIIRKKIEKVNFISILFDETADVANHEQGAFCLRFVEKDLTIHECCLGLYLMDKTTADYIYKVIKDVLLRYEISTVEKPFLKVRGQNYDGARSLSGTKTGVKVQILAQEKRALGVHCFAHSTNLAVNDALKKCQSMRNGLSFSGEIINLIKYSPKRQQRLKKIKEEIGWKCRGVNTLCITRWTVKMQALESIVLNYVPLLMLFHEAGGEESVPDMKARIEGCFQTMMKFDFFFGICLAIEVLGITDEFATALQLKDLSAAEGKKVFETTVKTLESLNNVEQFNYMWEKTVKKASEFDLDEPRLPRPIKRPIRFQVENASSEQPSTPKEHYQKIYLKAFKGTIECLRERFNQKGHEMYVKLQNVMLSAAKKNENYEQDLTVLLDFYGDDFDGPRLRSQLKIFTAMFPVQEVIVFEDIRIFFKNLEPGMELMLSEVSKLMELILVLPATTATAERCFSKLKLVLPPKRSNMTQEHLNHFMIISLYPDLLDGLDTSEIADEFVSQCCDNTRKKLFGKFETK